MYMTGDEIRALSRRIPEIVNATEEEISFWMDEAADVIHAFCQQDFLYERQTTKQVRAGTNTLVYLPKILSGDVTITDMDGGEVFSNSKPNSKFVNRTLFNDSDTIVYNTIGLSTTGLAIELFPGSNVIAYYQGNKVYRPAKAKILNVKGDWGFTPDKEAFFITAVNTLKTCYETHRMTADDVHLAIDTTNVSLSPLGTDLITALTLLNELQEAINGHFGNTLAHKEADTNLSTVQAASDIDSGFTLVQDLKKKFNAHCYSIKCHIKADETNIVWAGVDPDTAVLPRPLRRVFLRIVQRLAIRDEAEDFRQMNSAYTSETLGDGYTYDLSNGTLRGLIRPEEAHMLLPYVNRGRVVI